MKKIFALLLAVVMTLSLAACGEKEEVAASKLDQIKAAGKIVLGTSADYPPCEFHTEIDGKDTIVGYDISLAQYIADDLGVELEVVDMAFDGLCISLSKGDFDMVISGMSNTPERAMAVDFTSPTSSASRSSSFAPRMPISTTPPMTSPARPSLTSPVPFRKAS